MKSNLPTIAKLYGSLVVRVLAALTLTGIGARAQSTLWERQIDGLTIDGIAADATGTYVAGTQSGQSGTMVATISRYDSEGNLLWVRELGGGILNFPSAITVKNNFIYVAGTFIPSFSTVTGRRVFLAEFDITGVQIWTRSFASLDGTWASAVSADATGVYVGGSTQGALPGQTAYALYDAFIRKYDLDGNELWTRQFSPGDPNRSHVADMTVDASGLYVAWGSVPYGPPAGETNLIGRFLFFLTKYDSGGNEIWTSPDNDAGPILFTSVAVAKTALYVGGGRALNSQQQGINDSFTSKYDFIGQRGWTRQALTPEADENSGIAADGTGVYATGFIEREFPNLPYSEYLAVIKKYDSAGNELWRREFRNETLVSNEWGSGIAVYGNGLFVGVNSTTYSLSGQFISNAAILMKLDSGAPPVLAAVPRIAAAGIRNSASFSTDPIVAQGSLFTVFGTNLGPTSPIQASGFPLPRRGLAGTSIQVTVNGTVVDALVVYTSEKQVSAILPSTTPLGDGTLTVTYDGLTSEETPLKVVERAFGAFTASQNGKGPGVVQNVYSSTDVRTNTLFETARPGQAAVLWGTGLGPASGNEAAGLVPGDQSFVNMHLWVGGRDATLLYRGRSGCCAGVDQINFIVPSGVEGCYVPLAVQIGDVVSPYTSMSISSNGGTCSLPFGLSSSEIEAARARGNIRLGNIFLDYGGIADTIVSSNFYNVDLWGHGDGFFFNYPVDDYGTPDGFTFSDSIGADYTGFGQPGVNSMLAVGTCLVGTLRRAYPNSQDALDAGRNIQITSSRTELLTPSYRFYPYGGPTNTPSFKSYRNGNLGSFPSSTVPPSAPYVGSGPPLSATNESGGSGIAAVGGFAATPRVPQKLLWTNITSADVVNRAQGVRVTWAGGDPDGFVYINGVANVGQTGFSCLERASAGSFTVPPSVTLALPAAEGIRSSNYVGPYLYLVNVASPVRFDAPGLDAGFLSVSVGLARQVSFR